MFETVHTLQQYLDALPQRFQAEGAQGVQAVYQFELGGDGGATFHIVVHDGAMTLVRAAHAAPDVTLKASATDYLKLVNGTLGGKMAFLTGRLKVVGNIPLAMKLDRILPPNKPW